MKLGFRTPYDFYSDEIERMLRLPRTNEVYLLNDRQKGMRFLMGFMVWSYLLMTAVIVSFPLFTLSGIEMVLVLPFLPAGLAFLSFWMYRRSMTSS